MIDYRNNFKLALLKTYQDRLTFTFCHKQTIPYVVHIIHIVKLIITHICLVLLIDLQAITRSNELRVNLKRRISLIAYLLHLTAMF